MTHLKKEKKNPTHRHYEAGALLGSERMKRENDEALQSLQGRGTAL